MFSTKQSLEYYAGRMRRLNNLKRNLRRLAFQNSRAPMTKEMFDLHDKIDLLRSELNAMESVLGLNAEEVRNVCAKFNI